MDLTVAELIKKLKKCDGASVVMVNGNRGCGTFLQNALYMEEVLVTRPDNAKWSANRVGDPKTESGAEVVVVIKG